MRTKGSYMPDNYKYEVSHNGYAIISLFANITECSDDGSVWWEYDKYTLKRKHSEQLRNRITVETELWLLYAKETEDKELADNIRKRRNNLLSLSDKTQISDADISECCKEAWRVYRQLLRDIPEQASFPYDINWPEEPIIEKQTVR